MVALDGNKGMSTAVVAIGLFPLSMHCSRKSLSHSLYHLNLDTNNQDISKELTTEIIPCLNFGFLLTPLNSYQKEKATTQDVQHNTSNINLEWTI